MNGLPAPLALGAAVLMLGCLRAPINGEGWSETENGEGSTETDDVADGLSMSGPILPSEGGATTTVGDAMPDCHPAYDPCLPVVDDLNCDEVRAMDAAPVQLLGGEDPYGLDADDDGIGCEG